VPKQKASCTKARNRRKSSRDKFLTSMSWG